MSKQQNVKQATIYLIQTLTGYEVIPANFGWHIHRENTYCGILQYQTTRGWQGSALNCLPTELREEIKKFTQLNSSMSKAIA